MTRINQTIGILAATIFSMTTAMAANPVADRGKLERMAESAKTPKEHVEVAKHYRAQAEHFTQKAESHEAEARRLQAAPRSPIEYKWPAMGRQPWIRERQLAMEAHRAAKESLEASDRHMRMSVEQLAEAAAERSQRPKDVD